MYSHASLEAAVPAFCVNSQRFFFKAEMLRSVWITIGGELANRGWIFYTSSPVWMGLVSLKFERGYPNATTVFKIIFPHNYFDDSCKSCNANCMYPKRSIYSFEWFDVKVLFEWHSVWSHLPREWCWIRHSANVSTEPDDWLPSNGSITFKTNSIYSTPLGPPIQKRNSCLKSTGILFRGSFDWIYSLIVSGRLYISLLYTWPQHGRLISIEYNRGRKSHSKIPVRIVMECLNNKSQNGIHDTTLTHQFTVLTLKWSSMRIISDDSKYERKH